MSLDVYLGRRNPDFIEWEVKKAASIAEAGEMKGLIPIIEQYYEDRKPSETNQIYWANITHNLNRMAKAAGIYEVLWRPDEAGYTHAQQLIEPLKEGLEKLKADPKHFEQFNASNGWGLYGHFVPFVERYLEACIINPDAEVSVSR